MDDTMIVIVDGVEQLRKIDRYEIEGHFGSTEPKRFVPYPVLFQNEKSMQAIDGRTIIIKE